MTLRFLLCLAAQLWPVASCAGTLTPTGAGPLPSELTQVEPRFDCTHLFEGPFEAGDAAAIIAAAPDILCLDSPGGSLAEALTLTAWMKGNALGTKITKGARCLSACALVFMAGSRFPIEGRSAFFWRVLEPGAQLGFHAPSLTVPDGIYSEETVTEAYNVSNRSISRIIADLAMRSDLTGAAMPLSLLGEMLATPPQEMLVLRTVDQAGRWDISLAVAPGDWPPSSEELAQICVNAQAWANDLSAIQDWRPVFQNWAAESTDTSIRGFVLLNEITSDGCAMTVDRTRTANPLMMEMTYEGIAGFKPVMRFAPETLLADLPPDTRPVERGVCRVKRGAAVTDRERCTETRSQDGDAVLRRYVWPSGAETVISDTPRGPTTINGVATFPDVFGFEVCWLNSTSGNTFCFERG